MGVRCLFSMCCSFVIASGLLLESTTWEALVCERTANKLVAISVPADTVASSVALSSPFSVAITPDGTKALVPNEGSHSTITVLDFTQPGYQVLVGRQPYGVAITPDGTRALVTNNFDGTVSVLDLTQSPIVQAYVVSVGNKPFGVAITPDGTKALVANTYDNTVSVLEMNPTVHLIQTISVTAGAFPAFIAITPDGTKALVSNNNSSTVIVLDLTQSVIGPGYTVLVGDAPGGIAITPDGSQALVACGDSSSVGVLDLTQSTIKPGYSVAVGTVPSDVAITPDGKRAYVTDLDGQPSVLDLTTTPIQPIHILPIYQNTIGVAITPDQAPTSVFSTSVNGLTVLFDGSGSFSPVGGIKEYIWDFGDGSSPVTTTSPTVSHTYAKSDAYTVILTVVNDGGTSLNVTFTGQTVSNHGLPRARSTQVLDLRPLRPHKFIGKVHLHKHHHKISMKTKWHPSTDKSTKKYLITERNHKKKVIKGRKDDHATIYLHPRHVPHKLSKKYRRYLQDKYAIQSVNAVGTTSLPVPVHVEH